MHIRIVKHTLRLGIILFLFSMAACNGDQKQLKENQALINRNSEEAKAGKRSILFFGNSLTAGYGIDEEDAFPGLIQRRIDSLDLPFQVINGGLSGETTASGLSRLEWFLEEEPYIFVLELGGNDGLRGIKLDETEKNLRKIIEKVQTQYPNTKIMLAGMQIPPNMGIDYTETFAALYPKLAGEMKDLVFIPFLLEGVGGDPDLNLPDGIHPTEEGHEIVADTIWEYLYPLIK